MRSRDTSPEIHEMLLERSRKMSPAERLLEYFQLCDDALQVTAAGIQHRHPGYSAEDVEWALRRLRHGDALFRKVWPDAPLLES